MSLPHGMILCSLLIAAGQVGDNPSKPAGANYTQEKAARMEHMKQAAKSYEIVLASDAAKKLILMEEPLLRFDDQVTGVLDGTVFVWTLDDRPMAIASVWIRKIGQEFHELQSKYAFARMSSRECEVRREDEVAWSVPMVRAESPTDPYFNVVQAYTGPGVIGDPSPQPPGP